MAKRICVFCSSSNLVPSRYFKIAVELGALIGRAGLTLVYGGGNVGLMGTVAVATHAAGGKVVGVIPRFMLEKGLAYEQADQLIVTDDMRERKAVMEAQSDAFCALPGGFGTLEEILEIVTLKQLQRHAKPIVFMDVAGFYRPLQEIFEQLYRDAFMKPEFRSLYHFTGEPAEALAYLQDGPTNPAVEKWTA